MTSTDPVTSKFTQNSLNVQLQRLLLTL